MSDEIRFLEYVRYLEWSLEPPRDLGSGLGEEYANPIGPFYQDLDVFKNLLCCQSNGVRDEILNALRGLHDTDTELATKKSLIRSIDRQFRPLVREFLQIDSSRVSRCGLTRVDRQYTRANQQQYSEYFSKALFAIAIRSLSGRAARSLYKNLPTHCRLGPESLKVIQDTEKLKLPLQDIVIWLDTSPDALSYWWRTAYVLTKKEGFQLTPPSQDPDLRKDAATSNHEDLETSVTLQDQLAIVIKQNDQLSLLNRCNNWTTLSERLVNIESGMRDLMVTQVAVLNALGLLKDQQVNQLKAELVDRIEVLKRQSDQFADAILSRLESLSRDGLEYRDEVWKHQFDQFSITFLSAVKSLHRADVDDQTEVLRQQLAEIGTEILARIECGGQPTSAVAPNVSSPHSSHVPRKKGSRSPAKSVSKEVTLKELKRLLRKPEPLEAAQRYAALPISEWERLLTPRADALKVMQAVLKRGSSRTTKIEIVRELRKYLRNFVRTEVRSHGRKPK